MVQWLGLLAFTAEGMVWSLVREQRSCKSCDMANKKNTVKIFIFKSIVIRFPNSLLSLYAFFTHIQEYAHPCEQQGEKAVVMYVIWLLAILVEWEIAGSVGRRPVLSTGLQHYQWPWANHWQSYSLGFSTWKWSLQKVFQDTFSFKHEHFIKSDSF